MKRAALASLAVLALFAADAQAITPVSKPPAKKKPKKPGATVVSRNQTSNSASVNGETVSATATCPPGRIAVGGGFLTAFFVSPNQGVLVNESRRSSPTTWTVTGRAILVNPGTSTIIQATVYCMLPKGIGLVTEAFQSTQMSPTTGSTSATTAVCPAGQGFISGGFTLTPGTAPMDTAAAYQSSPENGGWTLRAVNNTATARVITSYAYCVRVGKGRVVPKYVTGNASGSFPKGGVASSTSPPCVVTTRNGKKRKQTEIPASGGGFSASTPTPNGPVPLVTSSLAGSRRSTWSANATNLGELGTAFVNTHAVCLSAPVKKAKKRKK